MVTDSDNRLAYGLVCCEHAAVLICCVINFAKAVRAHS